MLGAIAGDVIGSVFEYSGQKSVDFPLFSPDSTYTDDTVMTAAVASALLDSRSYAEAFRDFGRRHPGRGYGGYFHHWLHDPEAGPYQSWGNGSAMRVSPVARAFGSVRRVLDEARRSAEVTHDHPEGIRGAEAVALAVFLALHGADKSEIKREVASHSSYSLDASVDEIRPSYRFEVSCRGSVPQSIMCFLESADFEHAVRLAVSLGGDTDTMACIAGAIAEAHYGGVPDRIATSARGLLSPDLNEVLGRFQDRYPMPARSASA
jgi:ADP-ribosylglycohydrolase